MADWCRESNIKWCTLRARIYYYKWSTKDALTIKPVKGNNQTLKK